MKIISAIVTIALIGLIIWRFWESEEQRKIYASCSGLGPEIIKLSQEQENALLGKILKLYDVVDFPSPQEEERILSCKATAKWTRGGKNSIIFYAERDKDGDTFIGYELDQ